MNSFQKIVESIQDYPGALCSAFMDSASGMIIAQSSVDHLQIDIEALATENREIFNIVNSMVKQLCNGDAIGEIQITTEFAYHFLYPCKAIAGVFILASFSRELANPALIRRDLTDIEASLVGLLFGDQAKILEGLDVKKALEEHCAWRYRLRSATYDNNRENIQKEIAFADNLCMLGKWIHETGKIRFPDIPEMERLSATHARFHKWAGKVLQTLEQEGPVEARKLLDNEFQQASLVVQNDLVKFFTKIVFKRS